MSLPVRRVGYFPFDPGVNPYQRLFAAALEQAGARVERIAPRKWLPLQVAAAHDADVLQLDWPHDWYQGRNAWTRALKLGMYRHGLRRLRRSRVVWTVHNLIGHDAPDAAREHRMIQALIDECDGLIALSAVSAAALRATYRVAAHTEVAVIPHGHYAGTYPNAIPRDAARARLQLPAAARVVLSLGRLQPYKGLEELIAGFAQVAADGDVLLLAGRIATAGYRRELEQAVARARLDASRVRICDAVVPDADLQVYFNACDLVALPFRRVLNSGSLLLAMSFGCPVVAPRLGSIPEVACPEGWFGYDAATDYGLVEALRAALTCPDLARRRARVLEFTLATYDWGDVGRKALALYESIIERGPARRH